MPIVYGPTTDLPANRSQLLKQNAIESENRLTSITLTDEMPLNITLSRNPFGMETVKNDTFVVKWLVNATKIKQMTATPSKHPDSVRSTQNSMPITNLLFNASNELNLDAFSAVDQHHTDIFNRLKSLASTLTNIKTNGQIVDTTKAPNEENATQEHFKTTKLNVLKMDGKKFAHTTDSSSSSSKLPVMQAKHQSTITTEATIQSVFLDHLNSFNQSKRQNIGSIKNDSLNPNNQSQYIEDDVILSRTERSVQIPSNKRKRLHNDSSNAERIERSANFSLTKITKRIQLLIKGRFLQVLPDGTVNGTHEHESEYSK